MNINKFISNNGKLMFSVFINQIKQKSKKDLQQNLDIIAKLQSDFPNFTIQFFNESNVLNSEHIFNACYFVEKAFVQKRNISNKKHIEFLLYLSTKRQIKQAIDDFGVTDDSNNLSYCIISPDGTINEIKQEINKRMDAIDIEFNFDKVLQNKFNSVKKYFQIDDNQLKSVNYSKGKNEIRHKIKVLNDLICEKMALLSLEKT